MVYLFVDFMYRDRREFEEKDSVSPAMIHRITNPYQYHDVSTVLRNEKFQRWFSGTSGTRVLARSRSLGVR